MKIIKVKDKAELSVLTGEMLIGLMLSKSCLLYTSPSPRDA